MDVRGDRQSVIGDGGTKPLGSGAKGAWEGGLIIRGRRAKKSCAVKGEWRKG